MNKMQNKIMALKSTLTVFGASRLFGVFKFRHLLFVQPTCLHSTKISPQSSVGFWSNDTVVKYMKLYEDFVGLTEVKDAQEKVLKAESAFETMQHERRRQQKEMEGVQSNLKAIRSELEKVQRGDKKYLDLITEEFSVIKDEMNLLAKLQTLEDAEREKFSFLSSAVRESHEKERSRAERTKYWSVSASVVGVVLGIVGTSINNYLRMRELRGIVKEQSVDSSELKGLLTTLSDTVVDEHNLLQNFIGDLKSLVVAQPGNAKVSHKAVEKTLIGRDWESETKAILNTILKQDQDLQKDMSEIKTILSSPKITDKDGSVVYIGNELSDRLERTESMLEQKMKINSLWAVTVIYAAFALTLPVLYNIFRGT